MSDRRDTLLIENARIFFRNFTGKEGKYNAEGDRNFCLALDDDLAQQLLDDGWNVRGLTSRDPDEPPQPYIQVSVKYRNRQGQPTRPPTIVMITSRGRTTLPEEMIDVLDWADIKTVDLIVNPSDWAVNGKTGVKAYLKSLYVTINEDYLALKYRDIDDLDALPARAGRTDDYIDGEIIEERRAIGQ